MNRSQIYWCALLVAAVAVSYVAPVAVLFMFGLLIAWSLLGPMAAIQALTLATLLNYVNPAIAEPTATASVLARLVLLTAALRVLPIIRDRDVRVLWPVWLFSAAAMGLSLVSSRAVPISVMKALTFAVAVSTMLTAYNSLSEERVTRLKDWFGSVGGVLVVLSLLTLAVPHVAFFRNGTGLQGILNHPQALATALAPMGAWVLAGAVLSRDGLRPIATAALALLYATLFLTESRTGVSASLIGVVAAGLTWMFSSPRGAITAGRGRVVAIVALASLALTAAFATGRLEQLLLKFAFKRAESREVSGAFLESRGDGILSQWQNFLDQPLVGHGFGIFAKGRPATNVTALFGIPISAPVEKGFVFTAVLEETGIVGGALFWVMLFVIAARVWRNHDLRWVAMFTTCIAVNIGEAILLAPAGIGLLDWAFIGLCVASARVAVPNAAALPAHARHVDPAPRFPNLMRP